jgi:sodium-dependent dicarboxylate transporter 2/3/5
LHFIKFHKTLPSEPEYRAFFDAWAGTFIIHWNFVSILPLSSTSFSMKYLSWILGPLAFLLVLMLRPEAGLAPEAWQVLAVALWMMLWWMTEAVPLPVTALLPMILFPLLGLRSMAEATAPYADPIVFLFMGGFLVALAMQHRKLHVRIALGLIRIIGTRPEQVVMGFMLATALLSMWISNTATAVMMLPIAVSVISMLPADLLDGAKSQKNFALVLMLGIAYAANIGGTATIIGTPPTVVFVGYMREFYGIEVNFNQYMLFGIPIMLVMLAFCYLLMVKVIFPFGQREGHTSSLEGIESEWRKLGPMSRAEILVALVFLLTALAWIFRSPINSYLGSDYLNDTLIAMMGGSLMFIVPVHWKRKEFILDWPATRELPWGILLLFGGGLALAKAMEETGIIQHIGLLVSSQTTWPVWLLLLALTAIMLFATELMSNVALCVIFLPVVMGIADASGLSPFWLALPVTLASSYAFMMPVSTPPNAIVYSSGHIPLKAMLRIGLILNFVALAILLLFAQTLLPIVFEV